MSPVIIVEADKKALEWYWNRAGHGRGRVTGETARLAKAGLLRIRWTSRYDWVAELTARGQNLLIGRLINPWYLP